MEVSEHTFLK